MRNSFIWIAILVSLPLLILQLMFGVRMVAEDEGIPLLTLLVMNEFGAVLCAIATGLTVNTMKKTGVSAKPLIGVLVASGFVLLFIWRLLVLYPTS